MRPEINTALEVVAAGTAFAELRRALFITVASHHLKGTISDFEISTNEVDSQTPLDALLAKLPTQKLASVATINKGRTGIKDAKPGPYPLVVTAQERGTSDHFSFEGPGVMIPMVSSTGHGDASLKRVHFQDGKYAVGSILSVVQPRDARQLSARYLHAYLSSFKDELLVSRMVGTANVSLTVAKIGEVPVPLLPIDTQRKIDELMALCDRLEARQQDAEAAHARLVQALLDSLTQARDAQEFQAGWERLAGDFDSVFCTEASVEALRASVIELGILGRLGTGCVTDESAAELLKRLGAHAHSGNNAPLPPNWHWTKFSAICSIRSALVRPEENLDAPQVAPDCIEKGTGRLLLKRTVRESGVRGPNSRFNAGQIIYSKIRPSLSKVVLVDFSGLCSADMYPIDSKINAEYQLFLMLSETFLAQVRTAENRVKMPKLNQESLNDFLVPLPPLAEQRRIVAKVSELLALCDQLKARIAAGRAKQAQLAEALVKQAVAAAG